MNFRNSKIRKDKYEMKQMQILLNDLIKNDKIKFKFYKDNFTKLELLQLCYNKVDDTLELEFRNSMAEYLEEIKNIMREKKKD